MRVFLGFPRLIFLYIFITAYETVQLRMLSQTRYPSPWPFLRMCVKQPEVPMEQVIIALKVTASSPTPPAQYSIYQHLSSGIERLSTPALK
jgi:hypothetical protein